MVPIRLKKWFGSTVNDCRIAILLMVSVSLPAYAVDTIVCQISTFAHFPPYHWYDKENNKPRGYTHNIMSLLGGQLGFQLQATHNDLSSKEVAAIAMEGLISGETDVVFTPLFAVSSYDNVIVVDTPIYTVATKIFFLKNKKIDYQNWQSLMPYLGGYLNNYAISGEPDFDRYARKSLQLKPYPSYAHMVKALLNGEIDYLLGMNKPTWFELQLLGQRAAVATVDEAITELDIHILISKHSPLATQAEEVSSLLASYRDNGRMSTAINQAMREHLAYHRAKAAKIKEGSIPPLKI